MDYRYIWIAVSVLTSVSSSYGSQVITTSLGKTATLQCQIANVDSDLHFLYWRNDGTTIYSRTSTGEQTNGKYSVIDTSSLVITDVMESDAGNYSCKVVRQSFATEESDVMQLYVIDISVSHCKDTGQEVDGCTCSIDGSNITSLVCSASGFPHPPVITWEADIIIYRSSYVDLTRFSENITLTCKARDENLKGAVENKTVCVYYAHEVTSTGGSPVETTTSSVNDQARVALIVVSIITIILILVLLTLLIRRLAAAYRRKTGKAFRLIHTLTSTSKSEGTRVEELPTSQPESTSVKEELDNVDFSPKDCIQDVSKTLEEPYKSTLCGMNSRVNDAGSVDALKDSSKKSRRSSEGDLPTSQPESTSVKDELDDFDFSQKVDNQDVPKTHEEPDEPPLRGMNIIVNDSGSVDMEKDSLKSSKGSIVGDLPTTQPGVTPIKGENGMVGYGPQLPLVGQVLLDDLRSAPEETKESIKAAVVALVEKRVEPYKIYQSHGDPNASFMNATLQRSMKTEDLSDPDAAFVHIVLEDLDRILDEIDRDECEILITKPDFQEVTDESQIPEYRGKTVINQSLPMQANMTSSMTSSMVASKPLSTVLRDKLVKKPSERAEIRNAISQIILDVLKTGHSGLKINNKYNLNCSTPMLSGINVSSYADEVVNDEVSRLVAFWTSKTDKLNNDVNNRIKKYLFPLKPRNFNKSSDSHPVVKTRQEEDEIPDIPSTAQLLGDKMPS